LQTVRIELLGRIIRGHHEDDAARKQRFEQAAEDHRIGDVGDVELVEAEQPHFSGQAFGDLQQGIALALEFVQLAMDAVHEGVEMDPPLATVRHGVVEAVHQEALAAPDATPEIDPARHRRVQRTDAAGHCAARP
jgi:hypothetical protein